MEGPIRYQERPIKVKTNDGNPPVHGVWRFLGRKPISPNCLQIQNSHISSTNGKHKSADPSFWLESAYLCWILKWRRDQLHFPPLNKPFLAKNGWNGWKWGDSTSSVSKVAYFPPWWKSGQSQEFFNYCTDYDLKIVIKNRILGLKSFQNGWKRGKITFSYQLNYVILICHN